MLAAAASTIIITKIIITAKYLKTNKCLAPCLDLKVH